MKNTARKSTAKTVLVVGANGATGQLLVRQLLDRGLHVKAVVRSPDRLPGALRDQPDLAVVHANLSALSGKQLAELTSACDAVASCLGHHMSLKGVFGPPYRLVANATRRLAGALQRHRPDAPARFVLMNTAGNRNRDLSEPVSLSQRLVVGLIRLAVPPHADNENAADFLRTGIGQNDAHLQWCVVRPDTLTNASPHAGYDVFPSPIRSPIFDPGRTSRLNVARFMADLIADDDTWARWHGQMPVIYDTKG